MPDFDCLTDAQRLADLEERVSATIGRTFSIANGTESIEGRISQADFDWLLDLLSRVRAAERERCAMLHEQVNPASDDERLRGIPGAGAMGAIIEYRDMIRSNTDGPPSRQVKHSRQFNVWRSVHG